ncbi:DNA replication, recombinaison and repair protein [gamma proteobacterium NOR5-3]|nr:DNA replication, recombinaison and repair protein [gamma proteobacterium NOR5-3]
MPLLASLNIHHLRNLTEASLGPLSLHNVIYGINGSGKTSLLEAAHILGTARSFRAGGAKSLITHGEQTYVVQGNRESPGGGCVSLGVQRQKGGGMSLRVAGEPSRSVSQLADELPLLLINADSFDLLVGEPANRRRFMDWGVFHVEHNLRDHRRRFQRALTQRNHLLRRGKLDASELEVWTRDLAVHAELVSAGRDRFLAALKEVFEPLVNELAPEIGPVDLAYRRGWDASLGYADALQRSLASDQEQGFTQSGPQRADIRVTVGGYSAADTLSRGQQKLLICALKLAQGQILAGQRGGVLYLIDDLPSELDAERCERVCRALAAMRVQTLITCVSRSAIPVEWLGSGAEVAMFHVEQGRVTLVPDANNQ